MGLFDRPVALVGVIEGELLAGHMSIEMEHVAEVVVMEADLAVGVRLADGGVRPMIQCIGGIDDGVRGGRFLELGDFVVVRVSVVDFSAEPFRLEVGVFQRVGVHAVQTGPAARDADRIADGRADENLVVANVGGAEVGPPHEPVFGGLVGRLVHVAERDEIRIVLLVHVMGEPHLLQLGDTGDGAGLFTGLGEGGQQHGGQDRDDRDDDQQFNQREGEHFWDFLHGCSFLMFVLTAIDTTIIVLYNI